MKKIFLQLIAGLFLLTGLYADNEPALAETISTQEVPLVETPSSLPDEIGPEYRKMPSDFVLGFNPFEPAEAKADVNSELSQAMLKRIKGYVVQANGSPLLVIDGKSYRINDKVPMNDTAQAAASVQTKDGAKKDDKVAIAAAPIGGSTVTILNITPEEAVFRKDDPGGFGGETFKIYFNFKRETDETGRQNYNLWEQIGNGFFINEEGVVLVPLAIAQGNDLSVLTSYGYTRATLVESDTRRGVGLLKVNVKSIPLYLSPKPIAMAEAVFPAGFSLDKQAGLLMMEGFVKELVPSGATIAPPLDGNMAGAPVLNAKARAVGIVVGQTQTTGAVVTLSPSDAIFRKYAPSKEPEGALPPTKTTIEQSIVRVFRKK